jgi:hypothetical protein
MELTLALFTGLSALIVALSPVIIKWFEHVSVSKEKIHSRFSIIAINSMEAFSVPKDFMTAMRASEAIKIRRKMPIVLISDSIKERQCADFIISNAAIPDSRYLPNNECSWDKLRRHKIYA